MATYINRPRKFGNQTARRIILGALILASLGAGVAIGRTTVKPEKEVVTEFYTEIIEVEVPVETPAPDVEFPEIITVKYDVPLSDNLQQFICEISAEENVPVELVFAMIERESQFNADAISATNDFGLMQINKINHQWLEEKYRTGDMLNPFQNVYAGIKIIGGYLKKYDGNITKALMAYSLGEYGARKAWEDGVDETSYTAAVTETMTKYKEVAGNE